MAKDTVGSHSSGTLSPLPHSSRDNPFPFIPFPALYFAPTNRPRNTLSFLCCAKAAGFIANVKTLDTFLLGWRSHDLDTAYIPFVGGLPIFDPINEREAVVDPFVVVVFAGNTVGTLADVVNFFSFLSRWTTG
jgi:hypothetical protein